MPQRNNAPKKSGVETWSRPATRNGKRRKTATTNNPSDDDSVASTTTRAVTTHSNKKSAVDKPLVVRQQRHKEEANQATTNGGRKRKRGRPRKQPLPQQNGEELNDGTTTATNDDEGVSGNPTIATTTITTVAAAAATTTTSTPKRIRGRPRKDDTNNKRLDHYKNSVRDTWNAYFVQLAVYKHRHGSCPTTKAKDATTWFEKWVCLQRSRGQKGDLPEDQTAALDALGFVWDTLEDEYNKLWEERFQELVDYKEKTGSIMVPTNHPTGLGRWVVRQRCNQKQLEERIQQQQTHPSGSHHRETVHDGDESDASSTSNSSTGSEQHKMQQAADPNNTKHKYTEYHTNKLKSIGFIWEIYHNRGWEGKYQELVEYKEKHGNCSVPQHWPENKALGKFVARQRYLYCQLKQGKQEHNSLVAERIAKLEAIGFDWGKLRPNTWKDPTTDAAKKEAEAAQARPTITGGGEEALETNNHHPMMDSVVDGPYEVETATNLIHTSTIPPAAPALQQDLSNFADGATAASTSSIRYT